MPARFAALHHRRTGALLLPRVRLCTSFLSRGRGLMFRRALHPGEAIVLDERRDSRAATAIHMFFVPFPIAAVWINAAGQVVDKALALPWRLFYGPRAPARYILETEPAFLDRIAITDEVDFVAAE
ncbi:MAG: DUF192 domain-containing protein [Anaerolineales bacterium]|nr:DUF192 domain-containing protein [Anaerolineales bacterium]